MEECDEISYNTDLEDDETSKDTDFCLVQQNRIEFSKDQPNDYTLPRLPFDEKLAVQRSNRFNQTFGQIDVLFQSNKITESDNDTLMPLPSKALQKNGNYN